MDVQVVDRTNRRETQTPAHQAPPCTLVIFGAGGDLTRRLLMPAIYNLSKAKLLSDKFAIIAVGRTPKPVEAYRDYLGEGIRTFVSDTASAPATEPFDDRARDFVASRISHFAGDLTEPDTYARHDTLEKVGQESLPLDDLHSENPERRVESAKLG
jgi:glucose-6-phosphate 1-dehydrogenase